MKTQQLRPRVLVSYVREPYVYAAGNVRVTFDSNIRTSLLQREFLNGALPDIIATDAPGDIILEVKYDAFLPEIIRPKGNTSLTSIANDPTTDRYSFKLEFDHYVDGQTCFGLDKLILNNNYADATNMKEALIYDMYQYLGADASLYNYARLSVNGEYWGVYLALEAVEDSFLLRNYGVQDGELYKPDSMNIGGGGDPGGDFKADDMDFENMTPPDMDREDAPQPPAAPESAQQRILIFPTAKAASPWAEAARTSIIQTMSWTATRPSGTARSPTPQRPTTSAWSLLSKTFRKVMPWKIIWTSTTCSAIWPSTSSPSTKTACPAPWRTTITSMKPVES